MAGWTNKAGMGVNISLPATAVDSSGVLYTLGSIANDNIHRKYDPATNTWTALATRPLVSGGVYCEGVMYANAGTVNIAAGGDNGGVAATIATHSYSISGNTWTAKTNMPLGFGVTRGVAIWDNSDAVYVCGFTDKDGFAINGLYRYNIAANTWTTVSSTESWASGGYEGQNNGQFYNGKIFFGGDGRFNAGKYFTVAGGTFTAFTTASPADSVVPLGTIYGTILPYIYSDDYDAPANNGKIMGYRDMAVAPYTFVPAGPRTAEPAAGSVEQRRIAQAGRYIYLLGGWQSGIGSYTSRVDQYDQAFLNAPTGPTPAAGATVNNDLATLTATAVANGEQTQGHWQLATDAAFTLNVRDIYDDFQSAAGPPPVYTDEFVTSGAISKKIRAGVTELFQGTWYMRARSRNSLAASPWSATNQFTVSHPPGTGLTSPIGGIGMLYGTGAVTFQWTFSDTSETDNQTAYQLIVERNDTGASLLDTGKVASTSARTYPWTLLPAYKDITIRWKMRTWDSDDVAGPYSSYATFVMSDAPTVNITVPAEGSQVTNGQPTVNWTFVASGGRTQASYRVRYYQQTTNVLMYDSGVIAGSALTFTPPTQILAIGSYYVKVDVVDSFGLAGTDTNNFTTLFDTPAQPVFVVSSALYSTAGYIKVTWTNAEQDPTWTTYRVYRRLQGVSAWTLMYETTNSLVAYEYDDYTAGSGVAYEYTVVQVALRFSSPIESIVTTVQPGSGTSTQYWLIDNEAPQNNMILPNVTADAYTDEYEEETLTVIGKGRHKDYGTRFGYAGSLTAQFRSNARSNRLLLENLKALRATMLLRNPFGDVWQVGMGNIGIGRVAGTGTTEMLDVTIPYEEVA